MKKTILFRVILLSSAVFATNTQVFATSEASPSTPVRISGALKQWHNIVLSFEGPTTKETATPNPFSDYRMNVTFSHPQSGTTLIVPGYFAADGNAGVTNASGGKIWRAHLSPPELGTWNYHVSFRKGKGVATADSIDAGESAGYFDSAHGSFEVAASDKTAQDFRAANRGLLKNRGGHYFTFANGTPWIVAGANIPETLMGYKGFDNTPNASHDFHTHAADWNHGDPDWNSPDWDGKNNGRALIGALNYIAETGGNSIYFLAMNVDGDGHATYPTIAPYEKTRYDISKMDQWDIVFNHANQLGIYLHVILTETEVKNENYHDNGQLGPERKLYYRMLSARFGHNPALEWGVGEESDFGDKRNLAFAQFIKSIDPYDHPVSVECRGNKYHKQYNGLLGHESYDNTALQGGPKRMAMAKVILEWRKLSAEAGVPWVVHYQEPQSIENDKADLINGYNKGRRDMMWPAFMSGGGGFEWYIQEDGGITGARDPITNKMLGHRLDHQLNNFRDMDQALTWSGHALRFFEQLPVQDMLADHKLGSGPDDTVTYVFAKKGETYAVYNDRTGNGITLDLTGIEGKFRVRWYDPQSGGDLLKGSVHTISGGSQVSLGKAPHTPKNDWAVLVEKE